MAYVPPTPAGLKALFPAFAAVDDTTVQLFLDVAARSVDETWTEGDFTYARMLLAAHLMASNGIGVSSELSGLPEGVTNVRSGSFSMSISDAAASASVASGYGSTRYGREFAKLQKVNKGGPSVTGGGVVACSPYQDRPVPWVF